LTIWHFIPLDCFFGDFLLRHSLFAHFKEKEPAKISNYKRQFNQQING